MNAIDLPSLHNTVALSPFELQAFRKNGHIRINSLLNKEEAAVYREIINNAAYRYNTEKRAMSERDTYGKAFLQIMNLWERDEQVKKFTFAKRFARVAADLLGVENVRLYHDQALFKEPGGGLTPWHQDQYYWPLNTSNTVTMWMPLTDITEEMGMLTFASGSHKGGFIENLAISDESEARLEKYINDNGFPVSRAQAMQAGDASWHFGWTLHNAPGNAAAVTREVMTIIYFADGALVTAPQNENQEADRNRWLSGLPAGATAASSLNPLLS